MSLISLEEFLTQMRKELEVFEKHWREESAKDPTGYPMQLGAGEWYEQFLFLSSYVIPRDGQ